MRQRVRSVDRQRDDSGQAIVLVLIVAAMLLAALVVALTTARAGVNEAIGFKAGSQGEMAAQTGLATELTAMRNATSYSALPCSLTGSLSVTGASSTYSTTVAYSASGTPLICTGSGSTLGGTTAPTSAILMAIGKAPHGSGAVMKEDVAIVVTASTSAAVGYGIFTASTLNLTNGGVTVQGSGGAPTPTEYAEGVVTCNAGVMNTANLITYAAIDLSNDCHYSGSLTADGAITMEGSALVGGAAIAYGGGITLTGNATIGGNATATGGAILFNSSGHIGGNAYATGTISETGGPAINQLISGTMTPNDTSLSLQTMPAEAAFPTFSLPTAQTTPAWNIVNIPASQCSTYFSDSWSVIPDPFQVALESQTERTLYNASSCSITYGSARTFMLNPPTAGNPTAGDAILDVASLVLTNAGSTFCEESATDSDTCSSATTPGPNLTVFANASSTSSTCNASTESTNAVQLDNSNTFEPNVVTLIYTLGGVIMQNGSSSMTGQIIACGAISAGNTFTLSVNTAAAAEVLGSSSTSAGLSVNGTDKYVVSG